MYSRVLRSLLIKSVSTKYSAPKINLSAKHLIRGKINNVACFHSSAARNSEFKAPVKLDVDDELLQEEGESWNLKNKEDKAKDRLNKLLEDENMVRQKKIIELEIEVMRQSGDNVPEKIRNREWIELLLLGSRPKRRRYLDFLFGIEKKQENKRRTRLAKTEAIEKLREANLLRVSDLPLWLDYTLGGNSMFLRFRDTTMNSVGNWRLHRASMYGPKVVIDCGFDNIMTRGEIRNCAKQMQFGFAANREFTDPLDLHFCNFNSNSYLFEEFYSFIPTMLEPEFPINLHTESYLDLFPKDKLVYLTPDCHTIMEDYDADAVYIIGALVDKKSGTPTTLAKAKREGLRMAKLPIDKYLSFGGGSTKSLTVNQVVGILCNYYNTGDWHNALQLVPRRKLMEHRHMVLQKKLSYYLENTDFKESQKGIQNEDQHNYQNPRRNQQQRKIKDFSLNSRNKFRSSY